MSNEKNIIKLSSIKITGDMHVGDIYNTHVQDNKDLFVIFILAMNKKSLVDIKDKSINSLNLNYEKKLYIIDNDDKNDDLEFFLNSSFEQQIPLDHYDESSNGWKPFVHLSPTANNESIENILENIFKKRVTEVKCFHLDVDVSLEKLISNEEDKQLFLEILERSVILVDPLSLSHPVVREFFEEIYYSAEVGGILTTTCEFLPNDLKRFSAMLLKRIAYRWYRNWQKPNSPVFFKITDEKALTKHLLDICEKLGYKTTVDYFKKIDKEISSDTKFFNKIIN